MAVVEAAAALDGGCLRWRECDWQSGSCSGACGDRREDYVAGAEEALAAEACDVRATASCQGWTLVAGSTARVQVPNVLDRKHVLARSNHCSNCWAQAACAPVLQQQWAGHGRLRNRCGRGSLSMIDFCCGVVRNVVYGSDCTPGIWGTLQSGHVALSPWLAEVAAASSHCSSARGPCWHNPRIQNRHECNYCLCIVSNDISDFSELCN